MAQVTTITFRRTVNTGNFENFAVEATVVLDAEDHPGPQAAYLQSFVDTVIQERIDRGKKGKRSGMDAGEVDDLP